MNKIYKLIWSKSKGCYVVVSEMVKAHGKSASCIGRTLSCLFASSVLFFSGFTLPTYASGEATVTGTVGDDELIKLLGGTGIGITVTGNVVTFEAEYDPTLEILRKYIKFNAGYDSNTNFPTVAANSASSFAWGKNAGIYVYSLAESSEKNISFGANSKIYAGNMSNPSKNTGNNIVFGADATIGSTNIYGTYSTVVGASGRAYGGSNVVVGNSQVGLNQQIGTKSDGTKIWANVDNGVAVGSGAAVYSDKGTAVGGGAIAGKKPTKNTYTDRSQAENAKNTYTTAVGYGAHAFGINSTAIGSQTIATGIQNIALGTGSEARKDETMSVGFHAIAGAADGTAIGHDAVVFGDGGIALGHLVLTGMPALEGYRNNNLDESYLAVPTGTKIAGDSKMYFRTSDGTVLLYEVKIGNNGEENGKYYKVKAVPNGTSWKFVKVNAAGEEVANNSADAVQYITKESQKKDTRSSGKVNHIDYFYIDGQEANTKLYPLDEGVAIGTYISTEGARSTAIGMSSTAHGNNNTAIGLYTNTFGNGAVSIGHATVSGAQGHIMTNPNTGMHQISYKTLNNGIVERSTVDGTPVLFDKNFQYTVDTGNGTVKIWNGKIIELNNASYTQTSMKLASDNSTVLYDDSGYLYHTKDGNKLMVDSRDDIIVSGSGGNITLPAGRMMLSNGGVSIGSYSHASGDRSLAIGVTSGAIGQNSVALGAYSNAFGKGAVAIGDNAVAGGVVIEDSEGHHVLALDENGLGITATEDGKQVRNSLAIGTYAHASGNNSIAFGVDAGARGDNSVAIGSYSETDEDNTISVGSSERTRRIVHVEAGINDTDAVNVSQLRSASQSLTAGDNIVIDDEKKINVFGVIKYDDEAKSLVTLEGTRGTKMTNLKPAALTRTSTDAVIGNQLWQTNENVKGYAQDIKTNAANIMQLNNALSDTLYAVSSLGEEINTYEEIKADANLNNLTDNGKAVINRAAYEAVMDYIERTGGSLSSSSPVQMSAVLTDSQDTTDSVTQEDLNAKADISYVDSGLAGKADISYVDNSLTGKADSDAVYTKEETDTKLADKVDVSYVDSELDKKADKESVYTKEETDSMLDTKADRKDLDNKADLDAGNIDVQSWAEKLATGKINADNGGLVNGGQVYDAIQSVNNNIIVKSDGQTISVGADDSASSVSIAKADGTARVLKGIEVDKDDPSSAVNVAYIDEVKADTINTFKQGISSLDKKINRTGAGAAALANLHPLYDDGDTRLNIAAGIGRYHGETAGALGLFYRPSERVAMNISSTIGNDDAMFGAGVAVALDKGGHGGLSKAELAKQLSAALDRIASLEEKIAFMEAEKK